MFACSAVALEQSCEFFAFSAAALSAEMGLCVRWVVGWRRRWLSRVLVSHFSWVDSDSSQIPSIHSYGESYMTQALIR
ncbi:hypothetical protein R1flu_016851 [Riccia fluitans]|uniref:Secreted protein n=1 Tax=Riccia fluitans TaxID=41844 RepID=A0ABD1YN59_9MARC